MEFLKTLGINEFNPGAYLGNGEWSTTTDAGIKESVNPSNGEVIARVYGASANDYEKLVNHSRDVFKEWRQVTATESGNAIRLCTEALRKHKDA